MYPYSESNYRGTGCGKAARPGLWGSGEVTNHSTRSNKYLDYLIFDNNLLYPEGFYN